MVTSYSSIQKVGIVFFVPILINELSRRNFEHLVEVLRAGRPDKLQISHQSNDPEQEEHADGGQQEGTLLAAFGFINGLDRRLFLSVELERIFRHDFRLKRAHALEQGTPALVATGAIKQHPVQQRPQARGPPPCGSASNWR